MNPFDLYYSPQRTSAQIPTGYTQTTYPAPPTTRADEVKDLLEAAIDVCKIEPSQELFDKIFDQVYAPGQPPQERQEFVAAMVQDVMEFIGSMMSDIKERECAGEDNGPTPPCCYEDQPCSHCVKPEALATKPEPKPAPPKAKTVQDY